MFASHVYCLTVLVAIGAAMFFISARALRVEELGIAVRAITEKFARGAVIASESSGGPLA
jgi:hypothetical protein